MNSEHLEEEEQQPLHSHLAGEGSVLPLIHQLDFLFLVWAADKTTKHHWELLIYWQLTVVSANSPGCTHLYLPRHLNKIQSGQLLKYSKFICHASEGLRSTENYASGEGLNSPHTQPHLAGGQCASRDSFRMASALPTTRATPSWLNTTQSSTS